MVLHGFSFRPKNSIQFSLQRYIMIKKRPWGFLVVGYWDKKSGSQAYKSEEPSIFDESVVPDKPVGN